MEIQPPPQTDKNIAPMDDPTWLTILDLSQAGVPYLRTGLEGVGPAGKSVSQRAAGSAR